MVFCVRRMSLAHTASRDPTPIPCLLSLDTIFFQPLIPGKLIGVGCLSSRALLLCQTNRASIATEAVLDKGDEPGMFRQIKQLVFTAHAALLTGEPGIREALPEAEQVLLSAGITLPNFDTSFGDL